MMPGEVPLALHQPRSWLRIEVLALCSNTGWLLLQFPPGLGEQCPYTPKLVTRSKMYNYSSKNVLQNLIPLATA